MLYILVANNQRIKYVIASPVHQLRHLDTGAFYLYQVQERSKCPPLNKTGYEI